jgi:hypothetical protein
MGHDYHPSRYVTKKAPNSINITDRSHWQDCMIYFGALYLKVHQYRANIIISFSQDSLRCYGATINGVPLLRMA